MAKHYHGKVDMGYYHANKYEFDARRWCNRHGIWVTPFAKNNKEWWLDVTINGKSKRSPNAYPKNTVWEQCFKYYIYYYDKYKNKV